MSQKIQLLFVIESYSFLSYYGSVTQECLMGLFLTFDCIKMIACVHRTLVHLLGFIMFIKYSVIFCFLSVTSQLASGCCSRPFPSSFTAPAFNHTRLIKRPSCLSAACPSGFITPSSYTGSAASATMAAPPHVHTFNQTEMGAHLGVGGEVEGTKQRK